MARQSLASMPLSALLKLRDSVSAVIARRTDALKKELRALGDDYREVGRIALYGKKKAKRRKRGRKAAKRAGRPAKARGRKRKAAPAA